MPYRFRRGEEVGAGTRRIAVEQIDRAIDRLSDRPDAEAVHEVRKACKRLRGLLRLVRPGLGETRYRQENVAFRDIARGLSGARDADAVLEALGVLADEASEAVDFDAVAGALGDGSAARPPDVAGREALAAFRAARLRVSDWRIDGEGFAVVGPGLARTYARGRSCLSAALADPTDAALHEWRKRAKYHWYHVRLLQPLWPGPLAALKAELKQLSDALGDDHDLAVLRLRLPPAGEALGAAGHARLLGLLDERRAQLRRQAFDAGARLYAEPAKHLRRRMAAYWDAWQSERATRRRG